MKGPSRATAGGAATDQSAGAQSPPPASSFLSRQKGGQHSRRVKRRARPPPIPNQSTGLAFSTAIRLESRLFHFCVGLQSGLGIRPRPTTWLNGDHVLPDYRCASPLYSICFGQFIFCFRLLGESVLPLSGWGQHPLKRDEGGVSTANLRFGLSLLGDARLSNHGDAPFGSEERSALGQDWP